ncbi:sugar kinase [Rhodovulum sp. DZ06]|uniref:sugar kinase n=1 Tax=Rhodovulum sp. DZ06 TaxID=3425126 RepID=UPI003D3289E7
MAAGPGKLFLAVGEVMVELSGDGPGLWREGVAGDTYNTACHARRALPADWRVGYFTRLGTDPFSDRIAAAAEARGLETGFIARDPSRRPGLYAIALKDGERSFTYWRDRSAARLLADDEGALSAAFGQAACIHVSGITLAILAPDRRAALIAAMARARDAGAAVVFDGNIRPALWEDAAAMRAALTAAAGAASIALPSFDDEAAAFGDADIHATAARLHAAGAREVVVKNGGGTVLVSGPDGAAELSDLPKVTPVDTTGAGDSFNGAFLAARLTGAGAEEAVRAGHACASAVVLHKGALPPL